MTPTPPNPLPCGCAAVIPHNWDDTGEFFPEPHVVHCPLHAQAEALAASHARLLAYLAEIRDNCQNLLDGGLPHFERRDIARAVVMTCEAAIAQAPKEPT